MDHTYWHKQTADKPLFPDLSWSRPENKQTAGKLLIIGGNAHSLIGPAKAYQAAQAAGIGSVRVLLPDAVHAQAKSLENVEFAASSPSGSFSRAALGEWLELAKWADGVLLAGNLGHNSETAIVLEQFLTKYDGLVTLIGDTLDLALQAPDLVLQRSSTLIVPTTAQLQKLLANAHQTETITATLDFLQIIERLHTISLEQQAYMILLHKTQALISVSGKVSSTAGITTDELQLATSAAVWWLQNPTKPFEALTNSVI
jgi:NAD(P)H-hydrate repair Nnr-like enzyme with NAD(P)H-hydrate dehydratase domain